MCDIKTITKKRTKYIHWASSQLNIFRLKNYYQDSKSANHRRDRLYINHRSQKGVVSKIFKVLLKLSNHQKGNCPRKIHKWTQDSKHLKIWLIPLVTKKWKSKPETNATSKTIWSQNMRWKHGEMGSFLHFGQVTMLMTKDTNFRFLEKIPKFQLQMTVASFLMYVLY